MRRVGQEFVKREDVTRNLQREGSLYANRLTVTRQYNCDAQAGKSTCIDTNEKWISREQNLQPSATFIIHTAEPAVGPSRAACQKLHGWPDHSHYKAGKCKPNQLLIIVIKTRRDLVGQSRRLPAACVLHQRCSDMGQ